MEKLLVFDTTLRDGEQSPGASLTSDEKLKIAFQLEKLGVDIIEAGFPISSEDDARAVKIIGENIKESIVCALARCKDEDINIALKSLEKAKKPRLHLFLATSEIHRKYKLKKAKEEIIKIAREKVRYAKKFIDDIEFSPEDASRTEPDFLLDVCKAVIEEGAKTVNIPDTVGYAIPEEFGKLIKFLRENLPQNIVISVHCHNDLGLAVSNSLNAILNGARQVECTINGIGERAGNASLEEIVMNLVIRKNYYKVETNIKTEEIYKTSRLVSTLTGIPVQPNKAIVGKNAFRHEAGIHQDGILKYRLTYEIIDPKMIGIPESELVLGKHSGRHALKERLKILGFEFDEEKFEKIFEKFKNLADKKKEIHDVDLIAIAEEEIISIRPIYSLEYFHIISGSSTIPSATVRLKKGEKIIEDASRGDGPVDALYKAIDRITKLSPNLKEYKITAITGGKDAQGEVNVTLEINGVTVYGKGVSTDIIEASGKAYINAINFYLERERAKKKVLKGA
ncbi:MAG: 2-isopropylmalate synthase [bacterium]|nr:2-isopropylmalate synthase [bacterium]MCX7917927.1 2-isopropylmalate synthase [bacterium]MDW8163287.1 2-isopropylmalate synthase [Candidatus Omnitrophota bacterium]